MSGQLETALTVLIYVVIGSSAIGGLVGVALLVRFARARRRHAEEMQARHDAAVERMRDGHRPARGRFRL